VNAIPVRRGAADISAIKMVIGKLKQGQGVCLFPEATRTSDGRIAAFRGGFGLLCRRAAAPVVPVLIDGAFETWPRHSRIFTPGRRITVWYGKPIKADRAGRMDDTALAGALTDMLRAMQTEVRAKLGKQPYDYV